MNDHLTCKLVPPYADTYAYKLGAMCTKEHICATWRVSHTDQEEHANMTLDRRTIEEGHRPVEVGPPGTKKKQMVSKSVELPVLVNHTDVAAGDELRVFRPKAEKKRVAQEPTTSWADPSWGVIRRRVAGGA